MKVSIALAWLLLATWPAHAYAQARFGWSTDCQFEAGGAAHLAIVEPALDGATGEGTALGTIDCNQVVHELAVIERRPASIPSITLVGYAQSCVAPVTRDVVLHVVSRFEEGDARSDATYLAYDFDPSVCGDNAGNLVVVGGDVRIRLASPGAAPPPAVVALVPEAPEHCGDSTVAGFEIPEAHAWIAFVCNQVDPYVVREGRVIGRQSLQLQHLIGVLDIGDRTFVQATDVESRYWLGELTDTDVVLVAGDGVESELLSAHYAALSASEARYQREEVAADAHDRWVALGQWLCVGAFLLLLTLGIVRLAGGASGARGARVLDVGATFVLVGYGLARIVLGSLFVLVTLLFASSSGGFFPTPEPRYTATLVTVGIGAVVAGALSFAAAIAGLRPQWKRGRVVVYVAIGVAILFHVASGVAAGFEQPGDALGLVLLAALEIGALAVAARPRAPVGS